MLVRVGLCVGSKARRPVRAGVPFVAKRTLAMIVSVERALRACSLRGCDVCHWGKRSRRGGARHSAAPAAWLRALRPTHRQ